MLLTATTCFAQKPLKPSDADIAAALRGGRVSLETSKMLLEPKDFATLSLMLTIYPTVNGETLETEGTSHQFALPSGGDDNFAAPYKEGKWKIIKGGGSLARINATQYNYTAPATAPADNTMVISVDLEPTSTYWPKLVLLQTLYFVNNQTALVVNLPAVGFNNEKYISEANSGLKVPTAQNVDPNILAHMDAATKAKMEQAQAAVANMQQTNGINVAAITSNAIAYYDSVNNLTAIKLKGFSRQMVNGQDVRKTSSPVNAIFEVSYIGKGLGKHPLSDKPSGVGFIILPNQGCGCGNNRNDQADKAPCNGFVNITSMDKKTMKGEIWANVYNLDANNKLVQGRIHGKFTANITNAQQ